MTAQRRVLILTSDTGAGHRSVANALIEGGRARAGTGIDLVDVDPFVPFDRARPGGPPGAGAPSAIDRIVALYGPIIVRAPWLWGWAFRLADNEVGLRLYLACFGSALLERILAAAESSGAAAIVSVHPLVNHLMVRARARLRRPTLPLLTVVTDLVDVHRWWAAREVDQYVVGSDLAAKRLYDRGIARQKVAVAGIPLRREFGAIDLSAREMRVRLRLDPDLPTILLMGGGDGAGRLAQTARAIAGLAARGGPRFQLVVLAGRNLRARRELAARDWLVPVDVHGPVNNVAEHMTAADVIVTKPGSLTVSEALTVGRPLLLGRPLPGQEEGNVAYVVKAGAGFAYRDPAEAAEAVQFLLSEPATRWEMSQRAARLSRPHATDRTLDLLQGLLLRAEAARRA